MKQLFDNNLDESLKKLNKGIQMKPEYRKNLKERILKQTNIKQKKSNKKILALVAVASILLLLGSSPLYSTTMASLAAKIIPLEIKHSQLSDTDALHSKISKVVEQSGYEVSSIGTTPNPFTVHIVLLKNDDSLSSIKKVLEPKIEKLLYKQGIDQYSLDITQVKKSLEANIKTDSLMDKAGAIISEGYKMYGYSDLAEHGTYGITKGLFGNTLEIDMPDHVKEAKEIKKFVNDSIDKYNLNIKKVTLHYYNAKHLEQENRWAYIVNDIHEALAGKSIYNVTGISYKVKDGVTYIWIKTALSDQPNKQVISEIDEALRKYLESEKVKKSIQNDQYEIELLDKEKNSLLKVSSSS